MGDKGQFAFLLAKLTADKSFLSLIEQLMSNPENLNQMLTDETLPPELLDLMDQLFSEDDE